MAINKSELLALTAKEKFELAEELWGSVEDVDANSGGNSICRRAVATTPEYTQRGLKYKEV